MIDRTLEVKIKKTKEFMELWMKFHTLYKQALKRETITAQDEDLFLETKSLIARKYQALKEFLNQPFLLEDEKTFDVISQLLSLQGVSALSDVQVQEIESDWQRSYLILNKVLGSLENQKEALGRISPFSVLFPKVGSAFRKSRFLKAVKAAVILLVVYLILVKILHFDETLRTLISRLF